MKDRQPDGSKRKTICLLTLREGEIGTTNSATSSAINGARMFRMLLSVSLSQVLNNSTCIRFNIEKTILTNGYYY